MLPSDGWDDLGFHIDHQDVGRLTLAAKTNAGVGRLWPDAGEATEVAELYFFGFVPAPKLYVDVSATLPAKEAAYAAHITQNTSPQAASTAMHSLAARVANITGVRSVRYAEAFNPFF